MIRKHSLNNTLLLIFILTAVFFGMLFPKSHQKVLYDFLYSGIFLTSIFALEYRRKSLTWGAIVTFSLMWLSYFRGFALLHSISSSLIIIIFSFIVIKLIGQIARSRNVTLSVIIYAINGYLLIGLALAAFVSVLVSFDPNAFNLASTDNPVVSDFVYYTFVTMTTLGYGDISPIIPAAKALAIFISITGQMYVAILIALLVGKYSATQRS